MVTRLHRYGDDGEERSETDAFFGLADSALDAAKVLAREPIEWSVDENQLIVWLEFGSDLVLRVPALRFPSRLLLGDPVVVTKS